MARGLSPEDYQQACDLFNELREIPAPDLPVALDGACQGNAAVRAEVLRLLRAEQRAGGFLEQSAITDAAELLHAKVAGAPVPESIAHYRILSKLGEGGMGEVWRAHDSKLDREVAIKILPEAFAASPDRMARFTREAQVLASLSHPNITAIYGVEERALIMELVDGPTLAERIATGPIPWEEAAEIACQIAEALEAAHERGVVHRDLKPANIKMGPDGRVKVLDFGLSKAMSKPPVPGDPSSSAALLRGSMAGMIEGTAAYMAPEQAKGKSVDRRADIWAFGVVLEEMLTGRNPFQRESVAETLAAVLQGDPNLERVPAPARAAALPIIERCLRMDPRRRWQSMGDARIAIEEAVEGAGVTGVTEKPPRARRLILAAVGGLAIGAGLAAIAFLIPRQPPTPPPAVEFTVNSPGNGSFQLLPPLRVSPNGESIAFLAQDPSDPVSRVWLYDVAKGTTRVLPGTEQASEVFWSFDSRWLLFDRNGAPSRLDLRGNSPQTLPLETGYSSWGPDGIVTATRAGLNWFHPESADSRIILGNDPADKNVFIFPTLIPGTRRILYNAFNGPGAGRVSVRMTNTDGRERKQLFSADNCALYAGGSSGTGYALYIHGVALTAQALDPSNGRLLGEPHPVAGPVARLVGSGDPGAFSSSNNGVLAYRRANVTPEYRLERFSRKGDRRGAVGGIADYSNPAFSPDGNRLAVCIRKSNGKRDIWVFDLRRRVWSPITSDGSDNSNPVWSADGARLAFTSDRRGARDLYITNALGIGEPELILASPLAKNVEDWSRDGRWLVYNEAVPNNSDDLMAISLDTRKAVLILRTRFQEDKGRFSPDGKWLAYQSDASGRAEVYIQPFPPTGENWQISNDEGGQPQWRADGKELYYSTFSTPARMMAVDISADGKQLHAGAPHLLFEAVIPDVGARNRWVVTPDGQEFVAVFPVNEKPVHSFTVILNWPSLLAKR